MITFVTWKWFSPNYRVKYTADHVNAWHAGLRANCSVPFRAICVTDDPRGVNMETFPLWGDHDGVKNPNGNHLPSCYRRLKIFDPMVTAEMDIEDGSYVASLDLDVLFIRDVAPLLVPKVDFLGWKGPGSHHPTVYNGTFFKFKVGTMTRLWTDFDPATSPAETIRSKFFGSDQGWISYKLRGSCPGLTPTDGLMSYSRDILSARLKKPPPHARIISFNGKHKPWDKITQFESPWVKNYWRQADAVAA